MKVGIVNVGGGLRGVYAAGVLDWIIYLYGILSNLAGKNPLDYQALKNSKAELVVTMYFVCREKTIYLQAEYRKSIRLQRDNCEKGYHDTRIICRFLKSDYSFIR